ncbi:MAG TPA: tetratricopeptide repeat protein [Xanthomonadales bacterium]|nr:tetratricopeptide repeat protein [Xanthomonadales bacterium]
MPRIIQTFIGEIRRRRVLNALAIYAVTAWVVLQIAEVTFEPLGIPARAMRLLIIAALTGFPIVFLLTWLIEIGPKGLMFDLPLWPNEGAGATRTGRADLLLFSAVTLLMAFGIYSAVGMLDRDPEPEPEPAVAASAVSENSIAVLAFDNFDGQSQTDYFASGLAEEILNLLAGIPEMNVAARTSSFQFRGKQVDVREVAKTLAVSHVLEGSVRAEGGRIRVTAQLIDGRNGYHQLSKTFDREMSDVFAIQLEIANAVVAELKLSLSPDSRRQLDTPQVENLEAYLLYLQAREKMLSSPEESVAVEAGDLFAQTLKIDPDFSRAHAGMCEVKLHLYELSNDTREFSKAEAACTEAARLDPGKDSEISIALARLYRFRGWHERALEQVQKAIAATPESADAHIELGEIRMAQARTADAEASFRRAVALKSNYWKSHEALANFYAQSERYQDSVDAYAQVIRLAPNMASAHAGQGAAYWMLGAADQAKAAWDRSLALKPSRQAYTNIGLRYYYAGRFEQAAAMQQSALEFAPNDHRVWGRLAESYRFVPGKERESGNAYRRAADLAEENLEVDESDWATRGLLGLYYMHSDRAEPGLEMVDRAVTDSKRNPEALYYQGLARLAAGNREGAIDVLAEALKADAQYRQFLLSDPDLSGLRETARFKQVLVDGSVENIVAP